MNYRLTIVIVSWNTRLLIENCLLSVYGSLNGSMPVQLIVVDNGSSDGTLEMVRTRFPQVLLIENASNRGFAAANNQAISVSEGDYALLLNSDTLMHSDVLDRAVEYLDDNPEIAVLGPTVRNPDGSIQVSISGEPGIANLLILLSGVSHIGRLRFLDRYQMSYWEGSRHADVPVISGCCMFVRSAAISDVGQLDERYFFFGEETDWCKRFRRKGWRVHFAPIEYVTHFGGGSIGHNNVRRSLLLTGATVRFNRVHHGAVAAVVVFLILWMFALTRWIYWSIAWLLTGGGDSRQMMRHFRALLRRYRSAWPVEPGR